MGENVFIDLSFVVVLAVIVSYIMRLLKQPLIIGYIIVGLIVSLTGVISPSGEMNTLSQVGVAILLFMVGLNLTPKIIKDVGKVSLITGVGQVIFTSLIGFGICFFLGFDNITSLYIAIAITFSSTIVIMKLLSDKGDLETLYGKISIGFLIIQDIIAMLILMFVAISGSSGGGTVNIAIQVLIKGVGLVGIIVLAGVYIIPKLLKKVAKSQEFLELFSIGRCLLLASIFYLAGFSIEIGALIAGVTLSMSPYRFEISSKMKSLRDFFIVIFFVLFGTHMTLTSIGGYIVPILSLSIFILIGNPLIVMTLMGMLGYKKKTGFKAGLTVAQVSEFSFILIILGANIGHISKDILSLISIVGLITIAGSTYFILYSENIYTYLEKYLSIFEKDKTKEKKHIEYGNYEIILFGYDTTHSETTDTIHRLKKRFLVVDYDPEIIKSLEEKGISSIYGDASDIEFLDDLPKTNVKMIVSRIEDIETNMLLLEKFKNDKIIIITTSTTLDGVIKMYEKGANYVLFSNLIGGSHIASMIEGCIFDVEKFEQHKENHIKKINSIKEKIKVKLESQLNITDIK